MLFSPLACFRKSRKGPPWRVGSPWGDWVGTWEGIEVEANPTLAFRCLQFGFLEPVPPPVLLFLPLSPVAGS